MKRFWKILIGVVVAFALLIGMAIFSLRPTGTLPSLPNPNGYDDLVKAGKLIHGNLNDFKTLDIDALRGLVEANGEALRLLRVGLGRSCRVDTEAAIRTNLAPRTSDLAALHQAAILLTAEGRLRELENRPGDAARIYLDTIYIGCKLGAGGFAINRLMGVACETIGTTPLVKIIPRLSEEHLKPLLAKVAEIEINYISWDEVLSNEKHYEYRQIFKTPGSILAVPMARAALKKIQQKHEVAATRFRLLTLEVALRCYRFEHGQSPQDLGQLVPKYLRQLPPDPFSGRNMVYAPEQGTNWLLYSLGTNRVDNDGQRGTDLFFDSAW